MISVVTAAYNPKFLRETIESVSRQSVDLEHIVVDDGSDRISVESTISEYSEPRIRFFRIPHQGPASALNFAISQSKGEKVAVLDHDDVLLPNSLAIRSDFLDKYPEYLAVCGGVVYIDSEGKPYKTKIPKKQRAQEEMRQDILSKSLTSLFHCTVMYRSLVFSQVGVYNPKLSIWFDGELALRILSKGGIGEIPEPLTCYRTHPDNLSLTHRSSLVNDADFIYDTLVASRFESIYLKLKKRVVNLAKCGYQKVTPRKVV